MASRPCDESIGPTEDSATIKDILKLDDLFFQGLDNLDVMKFGICNLTWCNGSEGVSFTDSDCQVQFLEDDKDNPSRTLYFPFAFLFENGVRLFEEIKNLDGVVPNSVEDHIKEAFERLNKFFKNKEKNENDLKTVFDMKWVEDDGKKISLTETDITVAIAEHLLGKLAPGKSYTIDNKMKGKSCCKCGCKVKPVFGPTGIGHEEVWHGFIDIVFSSHEGIPLIANAVAELDTETPEKRRKIENDLTGADEASGSKSSPGGKAITEVKPALPEQILKQAIAQTIVFSLIQNQRHPEFLNHMVPNIVISPEEVQILMYDAANDVLLCSNLIQLFHFKKPVLFNETVVILWMVMHYRLFCSGLDGADNSVLDKCKSNFRTLVADKWEIYSKSLKDFVQGFPVVAKPSVNSLFEYGKAFKFQREPH